MDLDFTTDLTSSFEISLGDNPQTVSGNRALVNRFEIILLTKTRRYALSDGTVTVDNFGGDADKYINRSNVLNDPQSIAASVETAIQQTTRSILSDQPSSIPNTEKLSKAELTSLNVVGDVVFAVIRIYPVETEPYANLVMNLQITKRR